MQLLLLDKPTNGLDVEGRHELWAALSSRGFTVTHQRPEDLEELYWRLKDAS